MAKILESTGALPSTSPIEECNKLVGILAEMETTLEVTIPQLIEKLTKEAFELGFKAGVLAGSNAGETPSCQEWLQARQELGLGS